MNQAAHNPDQSPSLPLKRRASMMASGLILVCAPAIAAPVDAAIGRGNVDIKNTQAKRVVDQFMKALVAKNITSVMKVVAVPFFLEDKKNIKNFAELRKEFVNVFQRGDPTTIRYSLGEVRVFSAVKKKGSSKVRELLEEVMDADDRLVEVTMGTQAKKEKLAVLVSFRNRKVRVVGFRF
jgi:hypothetical protein